MGKSEKGNISPTYILMSKCYIQLITARHVIYAMLLSEYIYDDFITMQSKSCGATGSTWGGLRSQNAVVRFLAVLESKKQKMK